MNTWGCRRMFDRILRSPFQIISDGVCRTGALLKGTRHAQDIHDR